jgi:REP element-mobilizing transposase RayT
MAVSVSSDRHHRRSIRLPGFDYSQVGSYFITICAHERRCIFGEIVEDEMRLNEMGEIVKEEWEKTAKLRDGVELGAFVVMPNHFHAIVHIVEESPAATIMEDVGGRGTARCAPTNERENFERFGKPVSGSIPTIVRSFQFGSGIIMTPLAKTARGRTPIELVQAIRDT